VSFKEVSMISLNQLRTIFAIVLVTCLQLTGCATDHTTNAGSQSNWLACGDNESCPAELECQCGFCTKPCDLHDECAGVHARASCEAATDLEAVCGADLVSAPRVCALVCLANSDCGGSVSDLTCRDGFCVPNASAGGADSGPPVVPALDVEVAITADNAYGFGYGSETSLRNYFGGINNILAEDIFHCDRGPESYTVPAADAQAGDTLYIIAWADSATTQGVLAQFQRGDSIVYTGSGDWNVCATGVRYDSSTSGPEITEINQQIALCNAGDSDPATTSAGWVNATGNGVGALAVGEPNDTGRGPDPVTGNEFPLTCGIGDEARWMWFNWAPQTISWPAQTPFIWPSDAIDANPDKQFLIFKLAADKVVGPV
jgi:hypothetical protein